MLAPSIPPEAARSAIIAGYLHDLGKAHEIWQDAICAVADEEDRARIEAGRPWAKSGGNGPLLFADGVAFRHELASLLLIDGPLAALLAESPDPDLTKYLVLAHHGKLRFQVRERTPRLTPSVPPVDLGPSGHRAPAGGQPSANEIRGLRQGATSAIPAMLGQPATTLTVDLDQFQPDGNSPWTRDRARPARPLRPLHPRLFGSARPHLRLASQRRPGTPDRLTSRQPPQRPAGVGGALLGSLVRRSGSSGS